MRPPSTPQATQGDIVSALSLHLHNEIKKRIRAELEPTLDKLIEEILAGYPAQIKALKDFTMERWLAEIVVQKTELKK
jgi:hypothetical protein